MGIFSMFAIRPAKAFAEELAEGLVRDLPPKLVLHSAKVISANRVTTILERSYSKAAEFQKTQEVNGIQRAFMANAFRWKLAELGYPKEFITLATEGLLVHLSKSRKQAAA